MGHLDELVLDVRGALDAVVLGRRGRRPDQNVAEARFTDIIPPPERLESSFWKVRGGNA